MLILIFLIHSLELLTVRVPRWRSSRPAACTVCTRRPHRAGAEALVGEIDFEHPVTARTVGDLRCTIADDIQVVYDAGFGQVQIGRCTIRRARGRAAVYFTRWPSARGVRFTRRHRSAG